MARRCIQELPTHACRLTVLFLRFRLQVEKSLFPLEITGFESHKDAEHLRI